MLEVAEYLSSIRVLHKKCRAGLGEKVVFFLNKRAFSLWSTAFDENLPNLQQLRSTVPPFAPVTSATAW